MGDPILWYPETTKVFASIKGNCTTFIETGTCGGQGVKQAEMAGYKTIYSIEIDEEVYNKTVNLFRDAGEPVLDCKIDFRLGDSREVLFDILEPIDERCVFFLDAHDYVRGVAVPHELEIIKYHSVKTHTILIDDVPLYFGDGSELIRYASSINPNYKFKFLDCEIRKREPLPGLSGVGMRFLAYIDD